MTIACELSRHAYRKVMQKVALAFVFNGICMSLAAIGLLYGVWAIAVSVALIFFNSLWGHLCRRAARSM